MGLKAHVWAQAPNEKDLERLLSVVGKLPTFSAGTIPDRFAEFHDMFAREQRIRRLIWTGWSTLVLASAWFVDRVFRRRKISRAVRLLIFACVIALAIAATFGVASLSPPIVIDSLVKARVLLLFAAAAATAVLAVLFAIALFLRRWFRREEIRERS
jgi:hypothetical protein